jgi:hypothetical protein
MKNNTKVRLHLSKTLFENIVKEVVSEAKKMNMSGGAYTEAVKMPKKAKKVEETSQPSSTSTTSVQDMNAAGYGDKPAIPGLREKMSSKEKMAKGLYKEDAGALQPGENITWLDGHQKEYKGVIQSQEGGDYYKVKITAAPPGGHKVGDVLTKQSGDVKKAMEEMSSKEKMAKGLYKEDEMEEATDISNHYDYEYRKIDGDCYKIDPETKEKSKVHHSYCKRSQNEMQINVAEEGEMNEIADAVSWEGVAAGMAAIGLAPLAIEKLHQWWKKNHPESFKKAQGLSGAIDRQASGNTPGQGHGVDTKKGFGPQLESKKKVMPKLDELRKQIKNK